MKNRIIFLFWLVMSFHLFAQEQDRDFRTVFSNEPVRISGFGGPMMSFSVIDREFAHFMGGGGGVLINNFWIGGYGMGLTTAMDYPAHMIDTSRMHMGYGGLWFGYIHNSWEAVHPVFHLMVGWGGYGERENYTSQRLYSIFVLEPMLEMELNIFEFFKMGVGASYRYVPYVRSGGSFSNSDLSGPAAFLSFKFGWFAY